MWRSEFMKCAVVIPTLNAVRQGYWQDVLQSLASQTIPIDLKVIVDSASTDQTRATARTYGWKCIGIHRNNFDHGLTRTRMLRYLLRCGFDTVVFLSQDVIPAAPDTLEKLIRFLWEHDIVGCYGKQISPRKDSLNAWQRRCCYPDHSCVKSISSVAEDGFMAAFFSNAFSAWKIESALAYGGFEKTRFGEDTLLAARILSAGGKTGYCAQAIARHEHTNHFPGLFWRGFQVGSFHRAHPELLEYFGSPFRRGKEMHPPFSLLIPLSVKLAGYLTGRYLEKLLPLLIFLLIWLLLIPVFLVSDFPKRDVAARYAPMAEAFASGDWRFAFHPRITPLLPVCAGGWTWLFRCSGYFACQAVATLFLTLGVFPLYAGCRRIYGFRVAAVSCFLLAGCAYLIRLGYFGLRETGSLLAVLVLFYAAARLKESSKNVAGWLWFAIGESLLLLSRGDVAPFAALAFVILFLWDCIGHGHPLRSLATGASILVLLLPQLTYNYQMIGYPVPELRHAVVLRLICEKIPVLGFLCNSDPELSLDIVAPEVLGGNDDD